MFIIAIKETTKDINLMLFEKQEIMQINSEMIMAIWCEVGLMRFTKAYKRTFFF